MRKFSTEREFRCAASMVIGLAGFALNMATPSQAVAAADAPRNTNWLQKRRADQINSATSIQAFHGFDSDNSSRMSPRHAWRSGGFEFAGHAIFGDFSGFGFGQRRNERRSSE